MSFMLRKRHFCVILTSFRRVCEFTMDVGQRIKALREEKGMTLEELGNKVGVGKSTVRKWETGIIANMRRDKIAKIADALETSPAYLMGWEENASHFSKKESLAEVCDKSQNDALKFQGNQKEFHTIYQKLSSANQDRVLLYAKNLLSTQQMEDAVALNAAHDSGATPEQRQHADNIMEDPDEWM